MCRVIYLWILQHRPHSREFFAETTWDQQKPPETSRNHLRPAETTWDQQKPPEISWNKQGNQLKLAVLILQQSNLLGWFCVSISKTLNLFLQFLTFLYGMLLKIMPEFGDFLTRNRPFCVRQAQINNSKFDNSPFPSKIKVPKKIVKVYFSVWFLTYHIEPKRRISNEIHNLKRKTVKNVCPRNFKFPFLLIYNSYQVLWDNDIKHHNAIIKEPKMKGNTLSITNFANIIQITYFCQLKCLNRKIQSCRNLLTLHSKKDVSISKKSI